MAAQITPKQLIESKFNQLVLEFNEGDLSSAQFPRTRNEAVIEISTRISTLQWVLEMTGDDYE